MNTSINGIRASLSLSRNCFFLCCVVGFLLLGHRAAAFNIYNYTSIDLKVTVVEPNWNKTLAPNEIGSCNYNNASCNPSGSQTEILTLKIETKDSDERDWFCRVNLQAGGYAVIDDDFGLYVQTYDFDHAIRDWNAHGIKQSDREVRFLVSADCQFSGSNNQTQTSGKNQVGTDTNIKMAEMKAESKLIRGILYAGDLTQNAWTYGDRPEFDWYLESMDGFDRFFFEGLGNHDVETTSSTFRNNPPVIRDAVRDRKRNTAKTKVASHPKPHYSWDWHDIHFIQANVAPMDEPIPSKDHLDPDESLKFVKNTLSENVGASGRPVVLIHHYGFDDFSMGNDGCYGTTTDGEWWREEDRAAYWDAIKDYNVVAIFTGHVHLSTSSGHNNCWRYDWTRPTGATGGPDFIPSFVSGAAENGIFLDVEINGSNQIRVTRRYKDGSALDTECATFQRPVYVNKSHASPGYGWSDDAWPTVSELTAAINKSARFQECDENEIQVNITSGSYAEGVTFDSKALIRGVGGNVTIGQ